MRNETPEELIEGEVASLEPLLGEPYRSKLKAQWGSRAKIVAALAAVDDDDP